MDKDFVGMLCCPLCNEPIGLLLDRRLKKSLPKYQTIGPELCDKCKEKLKNEGNVVLYEAEITDKGPKMNGRYIIINENGLTIQENYQKHIQKERFAFCEIGFIDKITKGVKND